MKPYSHASSAAADQILIQYAILYVCNCAYQWPKCFAQTKFKTENVCISFSSVHKEMD